MENALTIPPNVSRLPALSERAREYVAASRSARTRKLYADAWQEFQFFCSQHGYAELPATPATVIDFITALAQRQRVNTLQIKLAAIAFHHRGRELPSPTESESVKLVMTGIKRTHGIAVRQKAWLSRAELARMIQALPNDLRASRDRAILLLGYAGAFRRSELATLDVEDVRIMDAEMIVAVRRSKTDQEGRGAKKRIPMLDDETLCPVRAVRAWLDASALESGALFRAIDRWGHVRSERITDKVIALVVKDAAKRAGLESRQFAGHSLRAGFVTQAFRDGVPEWQIIEVTGHSPKSGVVRQYNRAASEGQISAIRRVMEHPQ